MRKNNVYEDESHTGEKKRQKIYFLSYISKVMFCPVFKQDLCYISTILFHPQFKNNSCRPEQSYKWCAANHLLPRNNNVYGLLEIQWCLMPGFYSEQFSFVVHSMYVLSLFLSFFLFVGNVSAFLSHSDNRFKQSEWHRNVVSSKTFKTGLSNCCNAVQMKLHRNWDLWDHNSVQRLWCIHQELTWAVCKWTV